nr:NAD(P)H-hydrate dehydratase [Chloroflexaceae bacterium]
VARHLHDAGAHVTLYIWNRANAEQDANWQRCRQRNLAEIEAGADPEQQTLRYQLARAALVVDALLGAGVSRPVSGALAAIVTCVHEQRPRESILLAVDLPTGIDSDTGAVLGTAMRADVTVATGLLKRGLLCYPGRRYAGDLALADIGIPPKAMEDTMTDELNPTLARALLPARPADSHKGTYGKVMIVAGSLFYPGAAGLATAAAGRVGAGLVTLAAARSIIGQTGRPLEATLLPLPEAELGAVGSEAADMLLKQLEGYNAMVLGPGLGQEEGTLLFLQRLLSFEGPKARGRVGFLARAAAVHAEPTAHLTMELPPMVIDADGLNLLAKIENWSGLLPKNRCILTPHPGEMRRLLKLEELPTDLVQVATDAATNWGQVVVLKGATTIVAAPDGRNAMHPGGNPALATAGTGDVLAGVIGGLLAQGLNGYEAALLGVYLHGAAGALVREELGDAGAMASDLLTRLPKAIKALK